MAIEAGNRHVNKLIENVEEVERLVHIHSQITTKGPGRKNDVQILHKSSIVLLVACWEAYVEDLINESLTAMLSESEDHTVFPESVLERVSSKNTGMKAWNLAGDGWKKAFRDNLNEVYAKTTGSLNTPKTEQVDTLFEKTLGLKSISTSWHWKARSVEQARTALDDLVTLRGEIAHRVKTAKNVQLAHVEDAKNLISRLAAKSHNRVCDHLEKRIGKSPWDTVRYEGTG